MIKDNDEGYWNFINTYIKCVKNKVKECLNSSKRPSKTEKEEFKKIVNRLVNDYKYDMTKSIEDKEALKRALNTLSEYSLLDISDKRKRLK